MARADILIVEDHPTMREAMRLILEHEGFDLREAPDGATAIAMVRERLPDVMFLDLNIPGASGADVLMQLKADPSTRDVRVIIVTAQNGDAAMKPKFTIALITATVMPRTRAHVAPVKSPKPAARATTPTSRCVQPQAV